MARAVEMQIQYQTKNRRVDNTRGARAIKHVCPSDWRVVLGHFPARRANGCSRRLDSSLIP
jgi:hypothetical protein